MNKEPTKQTKSPEESKNRAQLLRKARERLRHKRWAEARSLYSQLLEDDSTNETLLIGYFSSLDGEGNFEDLLTTTQQVLDRSENSAFALTFKARALQQLNYVSEAMVANDEALLLGTNLPLAWINRSGLQVLQQKYTQALRSAKYATKVAPYDTRAWTNRGLALFNENDLDSAYSAFNRAVLLDKTNLLAYRMISEILLKFGDSQGLVSNVESALYIDPYNIESLSYHAKGLRALERFDELQNTTLKLIKLTPNSVFAWENYVRALRGTGKFEEANKAFDPLLDLDPTNVRFWTMKADTLYRLLKYRESIATADYAIYLSPDYQPARRIREQALKRMYQTKRK